MVFKNIILFYALFKQIFSFFKAPLLSNKLKGTNNILYFNFPAYVKKSNLFFVKLEGIYF